ncbi:hypothetical protein TeGR_g4960, partial [Tetraparma gracilis]
MDMAIPNLLHTLLPCCFPPPPSSPSPSGAEIVNYPSAHRLMSSGSSPTSSSSSRRTRRKGRRNRGQGGQEYVSLADVEDSSFEIGDGDEVPDETLKQSLDSPTALKQPATSLASFSPGTSTASPSLLVSDTFVLPGSALQSALAMSMAGVVDKTDASEECVICMEGFDEGNPKMLTLCNCGMNKTNFHYSCLLQWTEKNSSCPSCRHELLWEEAE